jgi:hypothetical protein
MLDQAYRVIRTLEKNLAIFMKATDKGMCPFCKATRLKYEMKVHSFTKNGKPGISRKHIEQIAHEKDCEIIRLLDEMEEWGCRP